MRDSLLGLNPGKWGAAPGAPVSLSPIRLRFEITFITGERIPLTGSEHSGRRVY
jgi:hypothetical protein